MNDMSAAAQPVALRVAFRTEEQMGDDRRQAGGVAACACPGSCAVAANDPAEGDIT